MYYFVGRKYFGRKSRLEQWLEEKRPKAGLDNRKELFTYN